MRILAVTHYWHPHRGGIETVALEQARRLSQRGHHVSIVTSRLPGDPARAETEGFSLYRVPSANWLERNRGIPYPLLSPQVLPLLARLAPRHDVVLVHNHTYLASVAATLVARARRLPTVLVQYNPFVRYPFPWNAVEWSADHLLGRYTLGTAKTVLAISEYTRKFVEQLVPGRPIGLLPLAVDTQRFTPVDSDAQKEAIRRRLGLPEKALVLVTVRRLVFRNGIDTLVQAARLLKGMGDYFVAIAGSGPERQAIAQVIADRRLDNVRLMGFVADDDLPDVYRAADIFVLPTRTGEGFGLVLLEAFASGIPGIATSGGGQEEVLTNGQTGLLVPPASPEHLAEAVVALAERSTRERMGASARGVAGARDWERCVDKLEDALVDAAGSPNYPGSAILSLPGQLRDRGSLRSSPSD